MINILTNANKVTNSALSIVYDQTEVEDPDNGNYFQVTRRATHSYSFIGLDRTAAEIIAKLKQAKYARFDTKWMRRTMDVGSFEDVMMWTRTDASGQWFWRVKNCANVSLAPEHNRWKVTVDVNEEDVAYSNIQYGVGYDILMGRVNDPVNIFNKHPQFSMRTYDDGDDAGSPIELTGNYQMVSASTTRFYLYFVGPFTIDGVLCPNPNYIKLQFAPHVSSGNIQSWADCEDATVWYSQGYFEVNDNAPCGAFMKWYRIQSTYDDKIVYSNPIAVSGCYDAE